MIQKICYFLAVIFFAAGTLLMGDLGGLARALRSYYLRAEPFFLPPVDLREGTVVVRTDRYGKGYFGASRNGGRKHAGVDLIAPIKGPVRAAKSGRIVRSAEERGYGKHVYILHPDRSVTRYAHLDTLAVQSGQWVRAGQIVGTCGRTGNAANLKMTPHLHFEIRYENKPVDPTLGQLDPRIKIAKQ